MSGKRSFRALASKSLHENTRPMLIPQHGVRVPLPNSPTWGPPLSKAHATALRKKTKVMFVFSVFCQNTKEIYIGLTGLPTSQIGLGRKFVGRLGSKKNYVGERGLKGNVLCQIRDFHVYAYRWALLGCKYTFICSPRVGYNTFKRKPARI